MTVLILLTAALLAVVLVAGLLATLVFAVQIRAFVADTAAAMTKVEAGASRLAERLGAVHDASAAAATSLRAVPTGSDRARRT